MPPSPGPPKAEEIVELVASRARGRVIGLFGPDSVTWRVARENVLLAGGPRALLMQLAHPAVASGVAQHSHVHSDPLGRSLRTFQAMYTLTFGDLDAALHVVRTVWKRHTSVVGHVTPETRSPAAGAAYRALDPDLLAWVWATLHDTMTEMYVTFVGPLDARDRDRFYEESKTLQLAFGIPEARIPATRQDHEAYVEGVLRGPLLDVSPDARAQWQMLVRGAPSSGVVGALMLPRGGVADRLLGGFSARALGPPLLRSLAARTLPPTLREAYGLAASPLAERAFGPLAAAVRRAVQRLPARVRFHPAYREAVMRLGGAAGARSAAA
jgi:uncharacterized protein (DUF2236 family)